MFDISEHHLINNWCFERWRCVYKMYFQIATRIIWLLFKRNSYSWKDVLYLGSNGLRHYHLQCPQWQSFYTISLDLNFDFLLLFQSKFSELRQPFVHWFARAEDQSSAVMSFWEGNPSSLLVPFTQRASGAQKYLVFGPDKPRKHHPHNYIKLCYLELLGCLENEIILGCLENEIDR